MSDAGAAVAEPEAKEVGVDWQLTVREHQGQSQGYGVHGLNAVARAVQRLRPYLGGRYGQQDCRPGGQGAVFLVDESPCPVGEGDPVAVGSGGEGGAVVHGQEADGLGLLPGDPGDLAESSHLVEDLLARGQVRDAGPAMLGRHGGVGVKTVARGVTAVTLQRWQQMGLVRVVQGLARVISFLVRCGHRVLFSLPVA